MFIFFKFPSLILDRQAATFSAFFAFPTVPASWVGAQEEISGQEGGTTGGGGGQGKAGGTIALLVVVEICQGETHLFCSYSRYSRSKSQWFPLLPLPFLPFPLIPFPLVTHILPPSMPPFSRSPTTSQTVANTGGGGWVGRAPAIGGPWLGGGGDIIE